MSIKKMIYKFIKLFIPSTILADYFHRVGSAREISEWEGNGSPIPPPNSVKQRIVTEYGKKYNANILVETGTYLGSMIYAQKKKFKEIHTIELSQDYYKKAQELFKEYKHIYPHQGDSAEVLKDIMKNLKGRAIFWLDAHYSVPVFARGKSDCPIFSELDWIFTNNADKHIILIDDAREFNGIGDYPSHQQVFDYFKTKAPDYSISIETDIFRCTPKS